MRIGRASDVNPIQVPSVVARKWKLPVQKTWRVNLVSRPKKSSEENINNQETGKVPESDPVRTWLFYCGTLLMFRFSLTRNYPL
jgi:hypothetical protein